MTAAEKPVAVDRERAAGRHLMGVALRHDERAEAAHLLVQQADRVGLGVVRAERVGADELGEAVGLVGVGAADGPHLVQDDRNAGSAICQAASEPARPPPTTWMGSGFLMRLGYARARRAINPYTPSRVFRTRMPAERRALDLAALQQDYATAWSRAIESIWKREMPRSSSSRSVSCDSSRTVSR